MRKILFLVALIISLSAPAQTISLESRSVQSQLWNNKFNKFEKSGELESTSYIQIRKDGADFYCPTCINSKFGFVFTSQPTIRQVEGGLEAYVYEAVGLDSKDKVTITFTFSGTEPKTVSILGGDILLVYHQLKWR